MKKLFLFCSLISLAFFTQAQNVAINNDGTTATSSAMLDVKSTTKGFMMPRMTSAQRGAVQNPALGLLVFDTDTKTVWAYNGAAWTNLSSAGGGGALTLPYENTVALAGSAFKLTNSGTSIEGTTTGVSSNGIRGNATANGSNGVLGFNTSTNGVGVRGEASGTGTGVIGYSTNGTGISAGSISGTGIYTNSISGLALNVNGNLKIAGGNTSPGVGKILTSDASGNAVWKTNRVAFRGFDINNSYITIPWGATQQIYYAYENYDLSSGFTPFESGTKPTDASAFSIPVDGIYHFEASVDLFYDTDDFDAHATIYLKLNRNGVISTLGYYTGSKSPVLFQSFQTGTFYFLKASGDFLLFPGDKVYVEVSQMNDDDATAKIVDGPLYAFTGHLVVAY
jgi:hypothetical protein